MFEPRETAANAATAANELTDHTTVRRFAALATVAEPLARLTAAISRCCLARGDDERNRLALHAECATLTEADQTDLAEHFEQEAASWEAASSPSHIAKGTSGAFPGRCDSNRELAPLSDLLKGLIP
jgi:hypothetical protein